MFRRLRRLQISLAVKCQLLFGAAVVLIIAATLYVPWQRMEQLMDKVNEQAAGTLAGSAIQEHISHPVAAPTTEPAGRNTYPPPRLVKIPPTQPESLTRFEHHSIDHFLTEPSSRFFAQSYRAKDGSERYHWAQPLYARQECLRCHSSPSGLASAATSRPIPLLGIISIDIPSQMEPNQILLNRVFFLTAMVLAGTVAIVVFYLIITRLILQPVRVLQETAEKASRGDLNIRSDISTGDEFQQLSETFNTMLVNLKQGADQLRAINKGLDLKLGQLAESNVALYESNRLKSEFLANVSHELRTPLNSILGFAELLKDSIPAAGVGGEGKTIRYLQNILASGRNLLELINDLLDLAKIEAGRMDVRSEPLSLNDLFEGLGNILKPLAEPRGLSILCTVAPDVPILQTDPAKLQQVLYNFLSNAIKFSPNDAEIELEAQRQDEEHVRISVTDRGPGIEPEKHSLIFEKFRQIDGSVTRQHSGTGLGLAISRELTALLGGQIGVESSVGHGATFWIVIPLKILPGDADVRQTSAAR